MINIDEENKVVTYENEPNVNRQLFPNIPLTVDVSPLEEEIQELGGRLDTAEDDISDIKDQLLTYNGQPEVTSTAAGMTDQDKIYVYVGEEDGYTTGDWYYYNGTAWVSGGAYAANPVQIDDTLTQAGEAADAKATGDQITAVKTALGEVKSDLSKFDYNAKSPSLWDYNDPNMVIANKQITSSGGLSNSETYNVGLIPVDGIDGNKYYLYGLNTQSTALVPINTRFLMMDAEKTPMGLLVNNDTAPAIVSSDSCKYLAFHTNRDWNKVMVVIQNTGRVTIPIYNGILPYYDNKQVKNQWTGKKWAGYGDSITAITNGDLNAIVWAYYVNAYYGMGQYYGRGIGSQSFKFGSHGGAVCFIDEATGIYNSRDNESNYDDYTGTIPTGCIKTRGSYCAWTRITAMFPASIKDTIDMVFVMGGTNDTNDDTPLAWVENDTTDAEWATSDYYQTYGGDYNINTLRGGVASTIMKMQAWMPNAIIVIGTPLNGQTNDAGHIKPSTIPDEYEKSLAIIETARKFGCPVIDVFGTCGINVLNSDDYISDGTHPYTEAGCIMLARSIIGGLAGILPKNADAMHIPVTN